MAYVPYLPESPTTTTVFPESWGLDAQFAVKMQIERAIRYAPELLWFPVLKTVQPSVDPANLDLPASPVGTTQMDPLWGEPIPATQNGLWAQPHLSGNNNADRAIKWATTPVIIHGFVQRVAKDIDLKRWGFDKIRDIIIKVPLGLLDVLQQPLTVGDKFRWGEESFTVMQINQDGYWKNSNIKTWMICNCETFRTGS